MSDPALALVEFASIAVGITAGDAMVKVAPLDSIYAGTVHPGKYLVLVSGDTASVEEALETGLTAGGDDVVDAVFLPELVYFVAAREAAEAMPVRFVPVDHAIVGIVDDVHLGGAT